MTLSVANDVNEATLILDPDLTVGMNSDQMSHALLEYVSKYPEQIPDGALDLIIAFVENLTALRESVKALNKSFADHSDDVLALMGPEFRLLTVRVSVAGGDEGEGEEG